MYNKTEHIAIDEEHINLDEVTYPVMEHFYTIQGEGIHTGKAAYFIRLAGCDVGCWWCDVKDSWNTENHPNVSVREMVKSAKESGTDMVVITGGEPLLHDLNALTVRLKQENFKIHIETSGSSPVTGHLDWITLSPKRFKKPKDEIFPYVDELKVIVLTNKDLIWAEENAAKCPDSTKLLLQPEWETPKSMPLIVNYVKKHPEWLISLQTHKFLGVR
ncbi:MAG TPA: 7-carboxy-7-deazaguanine synthase QueE [Balneolales bacterium]|nr:7-carboxy-7-deazaguanine synthase QueE [Balneolales bacterium]